MGAHILLRYIHEHKRRLAGAVLIAPMLGMETGKYSPQLTGWVTFFLNLRRPSSRLIFTVENRDPLDVPFEGNPVTSDRDRFERNREYLKEQRFLRIYGPTFGWLGAAFRSLQRMERKDFAEEIPIPLLSSARAQDRIVTNAATRDFVKRLPKAKYVEIEDAGARNPDGERRDPRPLLVGVRCVHRAAVGGKSLERENFQRFGVNAASPAATTSAALVHGTAFPIRDDAARAFDNRYDRRDVPALEIGLDDEIDKAHGDERIGVAIAAIAREPAALLDVPIALAIGVVEMQHRMGRADHGVAERSTGDASSGFRVDEALRNSVTPAERRETLVEKRLVEDAEDRHAVVLERDQRAP